MFFFLFVHVFPAPLLFFLFYFAAMENFDWPLLLKNYKALYFTNCIMYAFSLAVLIRAVIQQKSRLIHIIACYAAFSTLQSFFSHIEFFNLNKQYHYEYLVNLSISIFIIVEITCCYWLVRLSHTTLLQRRAMRLLLLCYYLFEAIYLSLMFLKNKVNDVESLVELPMLIVFCCIYYYNVFANKPQANLARQPLFWAMGGMALLAFTLIPYNIVYTYMNSQKSGLQIPMIINNISYCLLFCCFWQALRLTAKTPTHA